MRIASSSFFHHARPPARDLRFLFLPSLPSAVTHSGNAGERETVSGRKTLFFFFFFFSFRAPVITGFDFCFLLYFYSDATDGRDRRAIVTGTSGKKDDRGETRSRRGVETEPDACLVFSVSVSLSSESSFRSSFNTLGLERANGSSLEPPGTCTCPPPPPHSPFDPTADPSHLQPARRRRTPKNSYGGTAAAG